MAGGRGMRAGLPPLRTTPRREAPIPGYACPVGTNTEAAGIDVRIATAGDGCLGDHPVPAGAFVAFAGGTLAGVAEFHTRFYGHLFIELLLVDEQHRRRGVASALISGCAAACPTNKLFTSTNASNLAAQQLFLRSGFQVSGSIGNLDAGDPEIVFCKLLDRGSET
jgi:GNAT superfamily N-acetyltransferase